MLPIIDGSTRNSFSLTTGGEKKKYAISYSFHVDTGEMAHNAGEKIQDATEKRFKEVSRFVRRKYRAMRVKRALSNMRKSFYRKISFDLPIDLKALKSRVKEVVHA